ncbi:hypothetical protein [Sporosarcina gallistercoris]|uniref:Uncharacterized protein n=1 Tax=Sporosarcina gallistercoris TaxID=2762245 RepID=A0ABR8PIR3_9BACL|nr:hypothetical protein [Sporosarcina gallistercoris]MBD7908043.1 hypothetical protein [Sporosarcina gallistercoris]
MTKNGCKYVIVLFALLTFYQWIATPEIRWSNNIGISSLAFFIFLLVEWADQRYGWKKSKHERVS